MHQAWSLFFYRILDREGGVMARGPNEKVKKAEALYRSGTAMVEIAKRLGVSDSTVRSWKNRYKWDGEKSAALQNKKCNVAKAESLKKQKRKKHIADEVEEVIQNKELTDKQRLFCLYYIRCFNATKAYQKAYACDYVTAMVNGSCLLRNTKVKEEILRLKQNRLNREFFSEEDLFQKYMDIAFADITDFTEFGRKNIKVSNPNTGEDEEIAVSYVNIKSSNEVDGTLVSEVSKGKDGIKVKLADRMKAMQWLSDHMDLATEEQKARIAALKAKAETGEETGNADDGFIDALNASAGDDWSDEKD